MKLFGAEELSSHLFPYIRCAQLAMYIPSIPPFAKNPIFRHPRLYSSSNPPTRGHVFFNCQPVSSHTSGTADLGADIILQMSHIQRPEDMVET